MNTAIRKRRGIVVLLIAAALASLLAVAWFVMREDGPMLGASFLAPSYSSIYALSGASDAVIVGTVKGIVAREVDYGTADFLEKQQALGIPIVFYEVEVTETLQGDVGSTVIVGLIDVARINVSLNASALGSGEQVMLFLIEQSPPGITTYDHFYTAVSLDNGVFDLLADGRVAPRTPERFGASSYSVDEVRERIQR